MSGIIDFSQVEAATESGFLEPGMYRLKVDPASVEVIQVAGKNPYLKVKFVSESGSGVIEKFYLTPNTLKRMQYLHEAWFGKRLTKNDFANYVQVGEYFKEALTSKIIPRMMVVGGKIAANGNFYSGLPFTGFVIVDEKDFEEGPFDKDSTQYKRVVTVEKTDPIVANTDAGMLPEAPSTSVANGDVTANNSSPW